MNNRSFSGFYKVNLNAGECEKYYFVFGGDYKSVVDATKENIDEKKNASLSYFENISPFSVKTSDDSFDVLFKTLPYQILSSRVNGKTAFYQAGGATGFRDMAQDTLSLAYFDKRRAREELMKLCNHVYFEGDVMHWWHGENTASGQGYPTTDCFLRTPSQITSKFRATGKYLTKRRRISTRLVLQRRKNRGLKSRNITKSAKAS